MFPQKAAQDTAKVLQSYLTYQAVRTIIEQLSETNPTQAIWLSQYSSTHRIQDGEAYLEELMSENKEMVLRIMTVREYLAEQILELLPAMVKAGIEKANIEHRRHLLERLTQTQSTPEASDIEPDSGKPEP